MRTGRWAWRWARQPLPSDGPGAQILALPLSSTATLATVLSLTFRRSWWDLLQGRTESTCAPHWARGLALSPSPASVLSVLGPPHLLCFHDVSSASWGKDLGSVAGRVCP